VSKKQAVILVISPHPDDSEYGAAGTVAKFSKEGKKVVYVICTTGEKGTEDINIKPEELTHIREKEQKKAAEVLGVKEVIFLRYPDQELEDTPDFRKKIVRIIRAYKPDLIITSDPYRKYIWHRDHRITGRVVLDAVFPYSRDIWAYPDLYQEGLLPHKVKEVWTWAPEPEDINLRIDITSTFKTKLQALKCHKSQMKDNFSQEMEKWLCTRAQDMAKGENFNLAEGFHRIEIWW